MGCMLRTPPDDASRLVYALKLRFLNFLDEDEKIDEIDLLREIAISELARFEDLQKTYGDGYLRKALDMDISHARDKIIWFDSLLE